MLYRLMFVCAILFLPACTTESVVDIAAPPNAAAAGSVETERQVSGNPVGQQAALDQVAEEANKSLEALTVRFEKDQAKWMEQSQDERLKNLGSASRPEQRYAEDLVELAEKYPNTKAAKQAWPIAVKAGLREAKTTASQAVLAAAIAEPDFTESMKSLEFLMEHSMGNPQKKAMQLMLSRAQGHQDPEETFRIIKKIVTSRTGVEIHGDRVMFPGNPEVKQQAIQHLLTMVEADANSEVAVKCLNLIYQNSDNETQDDAIAQLFKHHLAHTKTMKLVEGLGKNASAKNEKLIKQAMSSSIEKVKINAAISLSRMFSAKQHTSQYYESTTEKTHGGASNVEYQAYLKTKPDPAELTRLEELLTAYIKTHHRNENDDLLAAAKNELFAMQNLAIGKHAPEINGEDLDGVEFKLSDYRGQIVFLDFWGDW